jgi:hypothetical protein
MDGDPISDMDWLKLAMDSHLRIPFHGIILTGSLIESSGVSCAAFIEFFSSLESQKWNESRKRTASIKKSPLEYRATLMPILRHAKTLYLIDPYLNSQESRYLETIQLCSEVMGQRGHAPLKGRIHIHAELKRQKPDGVSLSDCLNDWDVKLKPLMLRDGHHFKVFIWESLPGSVSMHDRYLITDQCAISLPGGLDCRVYSTPNETDWNLMDENARVRRLQDYTPGVGPYNLLGDREITV